MARHAQDSTTIQPADAQSVQQIEQRLGVARMPKNVRRQVRVATAANLRVPGAASPR